MYNSHIVVYGGIHACDLLGMNYCMYASHIVVYGGINACNLLGMNYCVYDSHIVVYRGIHNCNFLNYCVPILARFLMLFLFKWWGN